MAEKRPHKEVWGIRIEPSIVWVENNELKSKSEPTNDMRKAKGRVERTERLPNRSVDLRFELKIGRFRKRDNKWGSQFVTNPVVQQLIQNNNLKDGANLGRMNIAIFPTGKQLMTWGFQPFEENTRFKGKGMASFAELRIEKVLEKLFPEYVISTTARPTDPRKNHLQKRGRKAAEYISIQEAVRLTSDYVRKGMKEYNQRMTLMRRRKRKQLLVRRNEALARKRPSVIGGRKTKARFLARRR
ncbi:hypothetical protein KKE06_02990 [Candidatus Micrarchaeota archaeon]|nr:hypothetical protein [Candidatus Micrarchaeota archaeon]MBU1930031.1 hypothetical protein [Candidatus Micrarchaeota archaeon]